MVGPYLYSHSHSQKIFQMGEKMSCKSKKITHNDEFKKTAEAIYDVVIDLGEQGINAGLIASCLTMHATRLSFATCDDHTVIFRNLLRSLLNNIPETQFDFDEELEGKITHVPTKCISN